MNPFVYGSTVTGDAFIGRKDQIKELRNKILAGQNVVLYGERRMGKTSLVKETVRSLGGKCDAAIADLNHIKTSNDVISNISAAVQSISGKARPFQAARNTFSAIRGFRPGFNFPTEGGSGGVSLSYEQQLDSIEGLFERIERAHKEKPLVVFLDEFQGVLNCENSERLVALLRSHIQHQPNIPYIFAGSIRHHMYDLFMDPSSPFFKSAIPMEIGPIPKEELCRSVREIFDLEGGSHVEEDVIEAAYDWVHGTTGDLLQICSTIWDILPEGDTVDIDVLDAGIQKIIDTFDGKYSDDCRKLTNKQLIILTGIAQFDGKNPFSVDFQSWVGQSIGTIQSAVKKFEESQVLFSPYGEDGLRFADPFFQLYLVQQVTPPASPTLRHDESDYLDGPS